MKIGSKLLQPLPYIVECKSTQAFFEHIASFDCRQAADGYAADCKTANPKFEYRVTEAFPAIPHASLVEKLIVGKLVTDLLAAGLMITINNGGDDDEIKDCTDAATIFATLAASDQDELVLEKDGQYAGWIRLIWGNDVDVISDYSIALEPIMEAVNALVDELEG